MKWSYLILSNSGAWYCRELFFFYLFPAKFASGVGISVGELVVVFIVVQAVVIAKEEIKKTEVIFFIRKLLLKDKDINLNFTFNIINISKKLNL